MCLGAGSNRRPLPLQGNALPTELPKRAVADYDGFVAFLERTRHCTCFLIYFNQISRYVLLLSLIDF